LQGLYESSEDASSFIHSTGQCSIGAALEYWGVIKMGQFRVSLFLNATIALQGLYESIKDASNLGVPMYITETGLADAQDLHREHFIRSHYDVVRRGLFWCVCIPFLTD